MMDEVQKKEIVSVSNALLSKSCSAEFLVHVLDFRLHIFVFIL